MQKRQHIVFTQEGVEKLRTEQALLLAGRPDAVADLKKAREMGDLSENGYYKGARMKLSSIDRRLREIAHLLRSAHIVEKEFAGVVDIGCHITVSDGKDIREFIMVGGYESNPKEGKISHLSPVGKALIGKKKGDIATITIPSGKVAYEIIDIS